MIFEKKRTVLCLLQTHAKLLESVVFKRKWVGTCAICRFKFIYTSTSLTSVYNVTNHNFSLTLIEKIFCILTNFTTSLIFLMGFSTARHISKMIYL